MKKLFPKIILFFFFIIYGNSIFATHIMGGEITWECQNNGQYIFTLKVYRDCNGISYNVNNLALEAHNFPNLGNVTLIPVSFFSVIDITPSCEGSPCAALAANPSLPDVTGAIEEYVLKSAPITLNGVPPANGWAFTWTSGNRNAAIDNINNASNYGITLRAIMFPYFGQNANLCFDSSPDFYQKPSTIICAGEKFTYNHSAYDSDLDSLSYEWAKPLEGTLCGARPCRIGGVFSQGINPLEIPFDGANGYQFNNPFPDSTQNALNKAAVLNSATGEITFTSYNEGEFVSVIKVTAYKCGNKVAEIYRELQTVITSGCASNQPPEIAPLANNTYRDTVKVGDTVRFRINIRDSIRADNPKVDSIFIFGSGQQFGANFTNPNAGCLNPPCAILSTSLPDTAIGVYNTDFFWETTCDHIQNTVPVCYSTASSYQFVIRAYDDFCPAAGQTIATYIITILDDSLVKNPQINCANVSPNGDVTIDWDDIVDSDNAFDAYLIYVADFRNGPYVLLDSISDPNITDYTHIGANANSIGKHYIVRVRSGCQMGWTILPTDTISTIFFNPILNDTCVSFSWTGLDLPLPNNSDTNYLIYREYPVGSGFILYDSTNLLSYCDTFNVCTDTVTYRIELGNNGGDCSISLSNTQGIRFKYSDPNISLTAQPSVSCNGASDANAVATITGKPPFSYLWSTSEVTDTAKNLSAGKYIVTVTDLKGCTSIDSITITEPTVLTSSIGASTNVSCNAGSDGTATVAASGGTTPYTYLWPSTTSTANETGLSQGTYVVTVTDFNNCTSTSSVTITEPTVLSSTISASTNVSCNAGSNGTAIVTASGGTTPYSYAWPSATTTANETGLSQGTYIVTVTDAKSCTSTNSITITQPDSLKITSIITPVSCFGLADGELITTPIGGTAPFTFNWSNNSTDSINSSLIAGTYHVTITDANGCILDSTLIIQEPDLFALTVNPDDTICLGNSITIQATTTGGNSIYTYNWNNNLGNLNSHSVRPNTSTTYTVNVTDEKGCATIQDSIKITVRDLSQENLQAFSTGNICIGDTTTIFATHDGTFNTYSYSWNNNAGNSLGPISVSPTSTTTYIINTTDICGSVISDSVEVKVENYPLVNLPSIIKTGCEPLTVTFEDTLNGVSNNYNYLWNLGDGETSISKNLIHTYSDPGQYNISLKITTSGGCESNSASVSQVIVYSNPVASFIMNPEVTDLNSPTVTFTNTSLNTDNVKWDFYDSYFSINNDTIIQFVDTGWFSIKLIAINQFGCIDSTQKRLRINPVYEIKIPNAFTPNKGGGNGGFFGNNDLSNDVFRVHSDLVQTYEMLIFNRWGELIFQTKDVNQGWDGYYLGKLSPQDVYVYKVTVQWLNGQKETKTGNFTLFR